MLLGHLRARGYLHSWLRLACCTSLRTIAPHRMDGSAGGSLVVPAACSLVAASSWKRGYFIASPQNSSKLRRGGSRSLSVWAGAAVTSMACQSEGTAAQRASGNPGYMGQRHCSLNGAVAVCVCLRHNVRRQLLQHMGRHCHPVVHAHVLQAASKVRRLARHLYCVGLNVMKCHQYMHKSPSPWQLALQAGQVPCSLTAWGHRKQRQRLLLRWTHLQDLLEGLGIQRPARFAPGRHGKDQAQVVLQQVGGRGQPAP